MFVRLRRVCGNFKYNATTQQTKLKPNIDGDILSIGNKINNNKNTWYATFCWFGTLHIINIPNGEFSRKYISITCLDIIFNVHVFYFLWIFIVAISFIKFVKKLLTVWSVVYVAVSPLNRSHDAIWLKRLVYKTVQFHIILFRSLRTLFNIFHAYYSK